MTAIVARLDEAVALPLVVGADGLRAVGFVDVCIYIYIYIYTYIPTYLPTYLPTYIHTYIERERE